MTKLDASFESGNRLLKGKLFVPQNPSGSAVLFVHGFNAQGHSCVQYARLLGREGVTALTFDLSGHGNSEGKQADLSAEDQLNDVVRAYDYLLAQDRVNIDRGRVGIAGMSYGGYLASLAISKRPVKSLLLRSPPLYPNRLFRQPRNAYTNNEALYSDPEVDNVALASLRAFTARVVLVVSEKDDIVLPKITDAYAGAINDCDSVILYGAGHLLDSTVQKTFKPLVTDWAKQI